MLSAELSEEGIKQVQLIPCEVLGLSFDEPGNLNLLDTPLTVTAKADESSNATTYTVTSAHTPLNGQDLFSFLSEVKPNEGSDSVYGVIGDWDIVDRTGTYAEGLVQLHQRLGNAWQEFMGSRPVFLRLLEQTREPRFFGHRNIRQESPFLTRSELTSEQIIKDISLAGSTALGSIIESFEAIGIDNSYEVVLKGVRRSLQLRRNWQQHYSDKSLMKAYDGARPFIKRQVVKNILAALDETQHTEFVDAAVGTFYDFFEDDNGKPHFVSRALLGDIPLPKNSQQGMAVSEKYYSARIARIKHGSVILPGTLKKSSDDVIAPLLTWRTDAEDGRELIVTQSWEERDGGGKTFHDGVMGVLLLAYLSPELRAGWPTRMHLGPPRYKADRGQLLGVAQVPVLPLLPKYRRELLNSQFVAAAEAAVA